MERPPFFLLFGLVVLGSFAFSGSAQAATKYWIGGAGGNFSANTNWSTTSGGANDTTAPGSADVATFNGADTNNCTLDATVNVSGMDIRSDGGGTGYTGTITQGTGIAVTIGAGNFSEAAGAFTGSAAAITDTGTFSLSGGTFTSTSGTFTMVNTFAISGGTFNANSGTMVFTDTSSNGFNLTSGGATFNNVSFGVSAGVGSEIYTLIDDMTISGNLTVTGSSSTAFAIVKASGTRVINLAGNFTHTGAGFGTSGTLTLNLNGSGTQTITQTSSGTFKAALTIAKSAGSAVLGSNFEMQGGKALTINASNTLDASPDSGTTSYNLTIDNVTTGSFVNNGTFNARAGSHTFIGTWTNAGTFNAGTSTVTFTDTASNGFNLTSGGATFNNVSFGVSAGVGSEIYTLIDDMTISGNLTVTGSSSTAFAQVRASGTRVINLAGNFTQSGAGFGAAGTLTLNLNGSGTQTLSQSAGSFTAALTVANTGTASLGSAFTVTTKTTTINSGGTLDLNGNNFTSAGGFTVSSGGTLKLQGGETLTAPTLNTGSTVTYTGTSSYSSLAAGNTYKTVNFNGSGGVYTAAAALTATTALTIASGARLDLAGQNWTMTGATFTNNGTLSLTGAQTITGLTMDTAHGTVLYNDTSNHTGLVLGNTYNNLTINDGLVGYWKFDESSAGTFADSSGYGNTGTGVGSGGTNNTPQPSTSVPTLGFTDSHSLSFDGTDDYVTAGNASSLRTLESTAWTLSAWLYPTVDGKNYFGASHGSAADKYMVFYNNGSKIQVNTSGSSPSTVSVATTNTCITLNAWNHLVVEMTSSGIAMYCNGASMALSVISGTNQQISWTANSFDTLVIGGYILNSTAAGFTNGKIDDVRVYNRALTATEVSSLYAGTQPGSATATYTLNAALTVNGDLTLASGGLDVSTSNYGITDAGSWLNYGGVLTPRSGTVTLSSTASGKTLLSGNQRFNNLTVSGSGGVYTLADRLFVDGTYSQTNGTLDVSASNYVVRANAFQQTAGTFTAESGKVTAKATSAQTLTAASSLYNLDIENPNETNLVGYWKFDEGNGTTANDSSGNGHTGTLTNSPAWSSSTPGIATFDDPYSLHFDGSNDYVTSDLTSVGAVSRGTMALWVYRENASTYSVIIEDATSSPSMEGGSAPFLWINNSCSATFGTVANGAWHHLVGTWDGTSAKTYVDGVLHTTNSCTQSSTFTSDFHIGSRNGIFAYQGYIDDVRLYNTALSVTQVSNLYAGKYANTGSGATTTLGAALTVTNALTVQAGTLDVSSSNYAITSPTWTDNGVFVSRAGTVTLNNTGTLTDANASPFYNLTINGSGKTVTLGQATTATGNLTITAGTLDVSTGNYQLNVGGNFANSGTFTKRSGTVNLNAGIVTYWKFDEGTGTTTTDSSGNGYTGTLTNGPTWSTTVPAVGFADPYSLSFDGVDDRVVPSRPKTGDR